MQHNKTDDDDDVIVMRGEHNAKSKQRAPRFASQRLRVRVERSSRSDALRRSQTTQIWRTFKPGAELAD